MWRDEITNLCLPGSIFKSVMYCWAHKGSYPELSSLLSILSHCGSKISQATIDAAVSRVPDPAPLSTMHYLPHKL